MPSISTVASIVGAALATAIVAVHTPLRWTGPHASPEAAVLFLLLLGVFAYGIFALGARVVSSLPGRWGVLRVGVVVAIALLLAIALLFIQFVPALMVLAWCQVGLPCGDIGNVVFNSLLDAGHDVLVLVLLTFVTVPVLFAIYWLQRRQSAEKAVACA